MIVCLNGKFLPKNEALISVLDNGFLYGDAVYETLLVKNDQVFDLQEHLKRLQHSAKILGIKLGWPIPKIEKWVEKLAQLNKFELARLRITVSRGENGFNFKSCKKATLLMHCEKLVIKPEIYSKGIETVSMQMQRFLPEVKSTNLLPMIWAQRQIDSVKIGEVIMVDRENFVREGVTTNVFMVRNGVVWTPKNNILAGVVREKVLKLAEKLGQKVVVKDFKVGQLITADEIFLTNSLKGIIPVTRLDGKKIGTGVGEITKKLMQNNELNIM